MNKSIVREYSSRTFFSFNERSFVIEDDHTSLESHLNLVRSSGESFVHINETSGDKDFNFVKPQVNGLIPYSVPVYDDGRNFKVPFSNIRFNNIKSLEQNLGIKPFCKVLVGRIVPTNIKYNHVETIVYDTSPKELKVQLNSSSVEVRSKAEIIIPEYSNYGNMLLTVQKNCFIEIKLDDDVIDVLRLPNELEYSSGFIKGTFTKSGNYSIIVEYPDGRQLIDIVVPYYQRLL